MKKFSFGRIPGNLWFAGMILSAGPAVAQPLSGNYTIDMTQPTGATNFNSFNAAIAALTTNGVNAPVVFMASDDVYTEQLIIPQITGTSAINTITFTGNNTGISFSSVNSDERAVIKLEGADHIILDNLKITAAGTTSAEYGYGIQLINGADSNSIVNCTIVNNESTTMNIAANYAGIVVNSAANAVITVGNSGCDGNMIRNNTITGGFYGIALVADGASGIMIDRNVIKENTIQDFYNVGIYLNGNNAAVIEHNDISRPDRPFSPVYQFMGISLNSINTNLKVNANRMHDPFGANTTGNSGAFAIYMYNCSATPGNENIFSNNLCYNFLSNGIASGIDITNSSYNKFIHNTISLDDVPSGALGATKGFSIISSSYVTVINNNVTVSRGGTFSSKYCIYLSTNSNNNTIDNNNFFMNASIGAVKAVGYYGVNCITLNDWQNTSGYDAQSLSVDPVYVSPASGDFLPTNGALQAGMEVGVSGVASDILDLQRSLPSSGTLPTMGAFEIDGTPLPVMWSPLEARKVWGKAVLSWKTYTETRNAGFYMERSSDSKQWEDVAFIATRVPDGNSSSTLTYTYTDRVVAGSTYYRIKQVDVDGKAAYSNIVLLHQDPKQTASILRLWPNPAGNDINVEGEDGVSYIITDQTGRTVKTFVMEKPAEAINISDLPEGLYLLRKASGEEIKAVKFIRIK